MTVNHCAGRTAEGHAVEWVSRSTPISVRALQIMIAMESEDLGLRTVRPGDLGLTSAEAHQLAGSMRHCSSTRTEG